MLPLTVSSGLLHLMHGGAGGTAAAGLGLAGPIGIGMILGSLVLDIFGQMEEREEMKENLEWEAEQRRLRSAQLGATTAEELHDIKRESYYVAGTARAAGAAAGVKIGTGSMLTQEKGIYGAYRRKMEVIAEKTGYERAGLEREAHELEKRAKKLGKTDWWGIGASLLSGGYTLGSGMGWFGA